MIHSDTPRRTGDRATPGHSERQGSAGPSGGGRSTSSTTRRSQANVLAVVLLLGVTAAGVGVLFTVGNGALEESRTAVTIERAEQALLSLRADGSSVALGDAAGARVDLGDGGDGDFAVAESAGLIRVAHVRPDGATDVILESTLGTVRYHHGDTVIGYQAGGVWRAAGNASLVVAPPLTYRDETLSLPLIRVVGDGTVSGPTRAVLERGAEPVTLYPNASVEYGTDGPAYGNPVPEGVVTVTIQSEFYRGWATYFRTRTEGRVSVDHANETVDLELAAGGTSGRFEMPNEGNAIEVRGLAEDHGLRNFTVVLAPDDADAANFNNLQWSMYADNGPRDLEFHLRKSGELTTGRACNDEVVSATLYYSDTNGESYHGWQNETAFRTECTDRDGDGDADETRLVANLTGPEQLTLQDLGSSDLTYFTPSGDTLEDPVVIDEHGDTVAWEPSRYSRSGDATLTLRRATRHYLSMLGSNYDLVVDDKDSDTVNEDASYGRLTYGGEGRVTFMHISHRPLEVTLEG